MCEVVCLLRRDLEIETWGVVHQWLYNHKDMGNSKLKKREGKTGKTRKPRKPKPAPDTRAYPTDKSFAFDFLTLLFALRQYFQSLDQGPTKLRVGELCKRLYGYSLRVVRGLSDEDVRNLAGRLRVTLDEIPVDKPRREDKYLRAFYAWLGALGDVQWWERCMRDETPFS